MLLAGRPPAAALASRGLPAAASRLRKTTAAPVSRRSRPPPRRRRWASSSSSSRVGDNQPSSSPIVVAGAPVNPFQMNQYAFACTSTRKAALVDCGASARSEFRRFAEWLDAGGYRLAAVLQTHAHLDHVAGLGLLREAYPEVPIYLHESERPLYERFDEAVERWGFPPPDVPLPPPDDLTYFADDGMPSISVGDLTLDIVPTVGHSPGHVGYHEPLSKSFFGGDFIMKGSIGRTDFPTSDPEEMEKSLRRVVGMMEGETVIYPGHGPTTTLAEERRTNPFLRGLA